MRTALPKPDANPWVSLYWLVSGKTVGGTPLYPEANRLDRTEALRRYTVGSAWFSGEEDRKGSIEVGKLADLAVLSADYFQVPEEKIKRIESLLTVVDGKVVYATGDFAKLGPKSLPASPDWSPIKEYGGYRLSSVYLPSLWSSSQIRAAGTPIAPHAPVGWGATMTGKHRRSAQESLLALLAKESREYHVRRLIIRMHSLVRVIMLVESKREPYTIDDRGRTIKIWSLRSGFGRWFCFNCRQSGTTYHEPTADDCERMAELRGRAHECEHRD